MTKASASARLRAEPLHLSGLLNAACYLDATWSALHDELETYAIDKHVFRKAEGEIVRKGWEWTHCLYGLQHLAALHADAKGLGVGAGHEPIIFYLADRIAFVTATDLYGGKGWSDSGGREADPGVFENPERFCPRPIVRSKISFETADGMALPYERDRFDFCWSLSSIEHFAGHEGAVKAMREMARVTKPGGFVCIATEYLLLDEYEDPELFTRAQLDQYLIRAAPELGLIDDIDWDCLWPEFLIDSVPMPHSAHRRRRHVVLNDGEKAWTSIILFFKKT